VVRGWPCSTGAKTALGACAFLANSSSSSSSCSSSSSAAAAAAAQHSSSSSAAAAAAAAAAGSSSSGGSSSGSRSHSTRGSCRSHRSHSCRRRGRRCMSSSRGASTRHRAHANGPAPCRMRGQAAPIVAIEAPLGATHAAAGHTAHRSHRPRHYCCAAHVALAELLARTQVSACPGALAGAHGGRASQQPDRSQLIARSSHSTARQQRVQSSCSHTSTRAAQSSGAAPPASTLMALESACGRC
jgi:hypothetical protein